MNMSHSHSPTRRHLLLSSLALVITGPVFAGGEGGGNTDAGTAPRKPPATKSSYTQEEFARLSAAEIRELELKFQKGKRLQVDGFSRNMSDFLVLMAEFRRRRTQRLIRDMQKLKDKKKRVARLNREKARVDKELQDLEKAKKRAEDKGRKNAVIEAHHQISKTKQYLEGLGSWIRHPSEGSF